MLVVSVTVPLDDPGTADFVFSLPVTADGAGSADIFIETPSGSGFANQSLQIDAVTVRFRFEDISAEPGGTWTILSGPPACLTLPPGAVMPVPQSGPIA